jgi:mono/diheme cytochrome c family protein
MAVVAFICFWIVLGLGILFVAIRGGPRGARETWHTQSRTGRRATFAVLIAVYLGVGIAVPAVVIAGDQDHNQSAPNGVHLTAAQAHGRELFGKYCVQCHTLKAASAVGKVGPDLDELRPPAALVLDAISKGRGRGQGTMPADLVQGKDARDVASFVAAVAGR